MSDHSVRKVADLAVDERVIVERWLGRPLASDETVTLDVNHTAEGGSDERKRLVDDVLTTARQIGSHFEGADPLELDALIDEAFTSIRGKHG